MLYRICSVLVAPVILSNIVAFTFCAVVAFAVTVIVVQVQNNMNNLDDNKDILYLGMLFRSNRRPQELRCFQ